ncbi:MAG: hypothetical protein IJ564_05960, partial [Alphaproteobacteria bacterium]|nr:hypothetical protein [Alphaproteobacteria bacterium]
KGAYSDKQGQEKTFESEKYLENIKGLQFKFSRVLSSTEHLKNVLRSENLSTLNNAINLHTFGQTRLEGGKIKLFLNMPHYFV